MKFVALIFYMCKFLIQIWKLTKDLSLDNVFLELISNEQLSDLIMSKLSITIDLNQNQDI